jgi:NitT/TauT family transport system substrate-binding protein
VYVETVWPNFICNLLLVKQEFIDKHPERVKMLVQSAARSGLWAKRNRTEAARIAAKYWNQPVELVEYAMNTPPDRIVFDKFVPEIAEIQLIADLMVKFKLSESADVTGLVDDRWAKGANLEGITDITSVVIPPKSRPRTP